MNSLDFEILTKFKEISKRLIDLQKEVLINTNISLVEFKMLTVLDINEKFTQTSLSDFCNIDKPTTSRLISKLAEDNLVERNGDNLDRRKTYISLTDTGKKVVKSIREKMQNCYYKYFNQITSDDKSTFINLLNKTLNKEEKLC